MRLADAGRWLAVADTKPPRWHRAVVGGWGSRIRSLHAGRVVSLARRAA